MTEQQARWNADDLRERWAWMAYEHGDLVEATCHYGIAQGYRDDAAKLEAWLESRRVSK